MTLVRTHKFTVISNQHVLKLTGGWLGVVLASRTKPISSSVWLVFCLIKN